MEANQYSWDSLTRLTQDRQKWRDFVVAKGVVAHDDDDLAARSSKFLCEDKRKCHATLKQG